MIERIKYAIGHHKLDKLKPNHFIRFYANLAEPKTNLRDKEKPLSQQTILHHHRLLHSVLEKAVKWQYLATNPVNRVDAPIVKRQETAAYDDQQVNLLIKCLQKEQIRDPALIMLAVSSGARLGELLGLTWDDIDFDKNEININKAYQYVPGTGRHEKDPKTTKSRRVVAIPQTIMQLINKWRIKQNEHKLLKGTTGIEKDNAVWTTYLTTRLVPETVSRWFADFIKRHKLPKITFHGLRHTAATILIAYGASAPDVSKMLGHSTTTTTMNIYAHAFDGSNKKLAATMEKVLTVQNDVVNH